MKNIKKLKVWVLMLVTVVVGVGLNREEIHAESNENFEYEVVYTKQTFDKLNEEEGFKELEDYEYVYSGGDLVGIIYYDGDLEYSIAGGQR